VITNPFLVSLLLFITILTLYILSQRDKTKNLFKFLPLPFWCYFIPTLLSSFGVIPQDLPFYSASGRYLLPACLFLLLIGTEIKTIFHIKGQALCAMMYGSLGIVLGGLFTYGIAFQILPKVWQEELWKGWGALSATWSGGSANLLAIKEITNISPTLFSNLIVTDTFVAYLWMAFLVFLSKYQTPIDHWLKANPTYLEISPEPIFITQLNISYFKKGLQILSLLLISILSGILFLTISGWMPSWGSLFNRFTWTIIFATFIPLFLSQTRLKHLENYGASSLGQFLLYLMLASIGARANLSTLGVAPLFILLGIVWAVIHGIVLLFFGKIFRIPLSLLATSSQANIGGTISAPIVASLYSKNLTPIGVILATLGNIYGTYLGLLFSQVCRSFSDLLK